MGLIVTSIKLEMFKSYENVTINFNTKFNVIIGENNIGKTTIFEAMLLWKKCYDINIATNRKAFYKKTNNNIYLNFEELHFMRLSQDTDIYFENMKTCSIILTLFDNETNQEFSLGFKLTKPINIPNAYIRCAMVNGNEFVKFANYNKEKSRTLDQVIFVHQTKPVSNVLNKEPYMYKGQVIKKIEKGKSNEVLRNKVLNSLFGARLENNINNVLRTDFKFVIPDQRCRDKDEYIDLKVTSNDNSLDIFLQGSGFLQVCEIFSTIDVFDDALNVLLIDEPDSHISARIQQNLLQELKEIEKTQLFVISHNDNFVDNLNPNEIIFINETNKLESMVKPLTQVNLDQIHFAMGGIISSLTNLQKAKKILFVEGKDDIDYIKTMFNKFKLLDSFNEKVTQTLGMEDIAFCFIGGKDYLEIKLNNYKILFSQLVNDKQYSVIYDKDFCPRAVNEKISRQIEQRLGRNSKSYSHNGYCFESVLFSNDYILANFLSKITNKEIEETSLFVSSYREVIERQLTDTGTSEYGEMKIRFNGQKKDSRPELHNVDFDSFSGDIVGNY